MKLYPIIFAAIATLLASAVHGENTFTITGSLATARELHTSRLLPDCCFRSHPPKANSCSNIRSFQAIG